MSDSWDTLMRPYAGEAKLEVSYESQYLPLQVLTQPLVQPVSDRNALSCRKEGLPLPV